MATCPDCQGSGYCLIVDPIVDPTDPQPRIRQIPVGCGRCHRTGSVPDGQAAPPTPALPEGEGDRLTRWLLVGLAVCLTAVVVLVVVWPFGR